PVPSAYATRPSTLLPADPSHPRSRGRPPRGGRVLAAVTVAADARLGFSVGVGVARDGGRAGPGRRLRLRPGPGGRDDALGVEHRRPLRGASAAYHVPLSPTSRVAVCLNTEAPPGRASVPARRFRGRHRVAARRRVVSALPLVHAAPCPGGRAADD